MSFIDLDRRISFVHVPKTSAVVEILWRLHEGHVLYCAAHDSAEYLRDRFPGLWNPTVKVGFVRNPWAWWVSAYHWYAFPARYGTFREFLLRRDEWFRKTFPFEGQWRTLCDPDGTLLVDRVGRTETLQEDFDWICDRARAPEIKRTLPTKGPPRNHLDFYDDELRAIVAEMSARDIGMFGYTFG